MIKAVARASIVILVLSLFFAFSVSVITATTVIVNNVAPSLSAVSLTDTTGTPVTIIIPEKPYFVNFTVQDNNSIEDLDNIIINIFYNEATTPNRTNCYRFTYTQWNNEWVSNPIGYIVSNTTPVDLNLASFGFALGFKLDKDAIPSDSWHITINVVDDATNVINASIPITVKGIPSPTPTPKPLPAGGMHRFTNINRLLTTGHGKVLLTVTVTSEGGIAALTIQKGTIAKDAVGNPLSEVRINKQHTIPSPPPGVIQGEITGIKYAYNLEPDGATFNPPVTLSIKFDPVDFKDAPVIYIYKDGKWEALKTTVIDNKAFAKVSCFTIFTLFAEKAVLTPTPTPTPVPLITPALAPTPAPTPTPVHRILTFLVLIVILIVVIVITGIIIVARKRK